jgi:hypothetical protein
VLVLAVMVHRRKYAHMGYGPPLPPRRGRIPDLPQPPRAHASLKGEQHPLARLTKAQVREIRTLAATGMRLGLLMV